MGEKSLDRIRQRMEALGISQADLAKRTGIRASSISDYLNGRYAPKQDKIALIAEALSVSPAWLMGLGEEESQGYYTDPEVAKLAEEARINPDIRILFSASRDLSKKDMEKTIEFVKFLKSQKRDDSDFSEDVPDEHFTE